MANRQPQVSVTELRERSKDIGRITVTPEIALMHAYELVAALCDRIELLEGAVNQVRDKIK